MASIRTEREGSDNALTNVVWNCGTKARNAGPPLVNMSPNVWTIAIFTGEGLRSPTIRSNGPVNLTRNGPARYVLAVIEISSPRPAAAVSRTVGSP